MIIRSLTVILVVSSALAAGLAFRSYKNSRATVLQLKDNLEKANSKLADTTARLSEATDKLKFLDVGKTRVQATAYALTEDFGPHPTFANNTPARGAFAVPKRTLPPDGLLNVALSPLAERRLRAHLNDMIVLISGKRGEKNLGRFVDRTAQTETRPVVDILFTDAHEARIWGRQGFYAVDISVPESPFSED